MKTKKNTIQLTEAINKLRQENVGKMFLRSEMESALNKIGITRAYFNELAKCNVFTTQRIGINVLYTFPKDPIYKGVIEKAYESIRNKQRKKKKEEVTFDEKSAVENLKKLGYRIFKVQGVDVKKLRNEKPEIFDAYKIEVEI